MSKGQLNDNWGVSHAHCTEDCVSADCVVEHRRSSCGVTICSPSFATLPLRVLYYSNNIVDYECRGARRAHSTRMSTKVR